MKPVYKYDLGWQVERVFLKKCPLRSKLSHVENFFWMRGATIEDKERILNWADRLSLAYKNRNPKSYEEVVIWINYCNSNWPNYNREDHPRLNFENFSVSEIRDVVDDLLKRAEKWAREGYVNSDLQVFLYMCITNLLDSQRMRTLNDIINTANRTNSEGKSCYFIHGRYTKQNP